MQSAEHGVSVEDQTKMGFIRTIIDRVQNFQTETEGSGESSPSAVRLKLKSSESRFHSLSGIVSFL
jgi:hypothetical protein